MTSPLFLLFINYVMIGLEVFSITYLASGFFLRKSSTTVYTATFAGLILLGILSVHLLETIPILRMAVTIALDGLWIYINFETNWIKSAMASVLLVSFQWLVDSLFLCLALSIVHPADASIYDNPFAYYTLCYAAKLSTLFFTVLIRQWAKKKFHHQVTRRADWLRVSIIPFSVVLISLYLSSLLPLAPQFSSGLFLCTLLLLLLDITSILLLGHLERQQQALLNSAIMQRNLKLEQDHLLAVEETYTAQRKQTHDFGNLLAVLRTMAEQKAPQEEFAQYLGRILAMDFPTVSYISTHRRVADILLDQKSALAKSKGIALELQLDDLSSFPLPDDALVVVLTNLLDNAIEACEKIPVPDCRQITLKMQVRPSGALLYIENTTPGPVHIRNNRIATTKADPMAHGYGLPNICAMLAQNDATFAMTYREEGRFCFSAKFPFPQ